MSNVRYLQTISDTRTGNVYTASLAVQTLSMRWQRRQSSVEYLDAPGSFDPRGRAAAPLQARTVDVLLRVVYDATTPNYAAAWNAFLLGPGAGRLVVMTFIDGDGSPWYADARCTTADMQSGIDYFNHCDIPCSFFLASPFLYRPVDQQRADTGLHADTGLNADAGFPTATITSNTASLSFTNAAALPDGGTRVILDGPLTAPIAVTSGNVAVANPVTGAGRYFVYNRNIASGESVVVNSATGDVNSSTFGVLAYQYFTSDNVSESYFPVGPGANPVSVATGSASGQNGRITIIYRALTL